jgi:biopolymer transport protein ExbD
MSVKIGKGRALGVISFTPLVDVVFLLLIFFLVATRFEEEEREMDATLPQASEARPLTSKPQELIVNIDREDTYVVRRVTYTSEALERLLRQAAVNNPGRQAVKIRADEQCHWKYVVEVMNLCNRVGIRDYSPVVAPGT